MNSKFGQRNIKLVAQFEATAESADGVSWYVLVETNINGDQRDHDEGPMSLDDCLNRVYENSQNHMAAIEAAVEEMRNGV